MPITSSSGGPAPSNDKSVTVLFDPAKNSFSYSGDIDPATEEIKVTTVGTVNINFVLEGAVWADVPIKWVTVQKQGAPTPGCMTVNVTGDKQLTIVDVCTEAAAGAYYFLVCVKKSDGTTVCSDPRIYNDPLAP